jgi:NADH:flavin oxidoreductase / NADH oxidase family
MNILTPARIGPVEVKNRIVMPPMTTRTADDEGFITEDSIAYYMARVRGGTGLITVEMASPEKAGRRPYACGHKRQDAHRTVGHSTPGLRDDIRDHRARGDDGRAHSRNDGGLCCRPATSGRTCWRPPQGDGSYPLPVSSRALPRLP